MCVQSFSRPRKPLQNRVRESSPEMVASVPMAPFWGEEDEGREEGGEGEKEEDDSCRGRVSSSVSSSSPPDSFSEDVFTLPNSEPYIPPSSYGSADAPPPTTRLCRTWTWDRCDVNKWLAGVQVETELVLFVEHTTSFKNKPLASRTHQLDLD
jgi:hypothetical protein